MQDVNMINKAFDLAVKGLKDEWFLLQDDNWYNYVVSL
jgi:hypothetical protein